MKPFVRRGLLVLTVLSITTALFFVLSTRPANVPALLPENTYVIEGVSWQARWQLFLLRRGSELLNLLVDMETVDITEIRRFRHNMEAKRQPRAGIHTEQVSKPGLNGVRYRQQSNHDDFILLSFHGGAYTSGSPNSHYHLSANLVEATGWDVIAPRYRLAPEHPYPAAVDDAEAAYRALLEDWRPEQILVTGESAGGGLTLALMLRLKAQGLPLPRALLLFSPWTDVSLSSETVTTNADHDFLNPREIQRWARTYHGKSDPRHPEISPIYGDLGGLPPTLILAGTEEIILGDSIRLQEKLSNNGVKSQLSIWQGLWHIWPNAAPDKFPEVSRSMAQSAQFLRDQTNP